MHRVLALLVLLAFCMPAFGWGRTGHRLVGSLAERDLTPAARREVGRLLAGEPQPTLAGVSIWADDVRAKDPVLGPRSAPWHYVNIRSPDCRYRAARDCAGGDCVVEAIRVQTAILADRRRPLADRRQALKFVVHFVGDIHQPLHAGNRDDKGGNTVQVRIPTRTGERGGNLHSLWDSGLIDFTGRGERAYLARLLRIPGEAERLLPAQGDAAAWASQACAVTLRRGLYPRRAKLPAGYMSRWTPVAEVQMRRAGERLARVLNGALSR